MNELQIYSITVNSVDLPCHVRISQHVVDYLTLLRCKV